MILLQCEVLDIPLVIVVESYTYVPEVWQTHPHDCQDDYIDVKGGYVAFDFVPGEPYMGVTDEEKDIIDKVKNKDVDFFFGLCREHALDLLEAYHDQKRG